MLRSVWRSGTLVRLSSPVSHFAPCCSWTSTARSTAVPATIVARSFSSVDPHTVAALDSIRDDNNKVKAAEKSPKKKSRRKEKRMKRPSEAKARALFDRVAPHLPLTTLKAVIRKLKRKAPRISAQTRVGQVRDLLESVNAMDPWVKQRFSEFLLLKQFVKLKDKQSFPVTANKALLDTHVGILQRAQRLSMQRPLLWSIKQRRRETKSKNAAIDKNDSASSCVDNQSDNTSTEETRPVRHSKSEETRRQEAQELVEVLAERLPEKAYKDLIQSFSDYVEQTTNPQKPKMRMLFTHLNRCVFTHIHLVADRVATFFDVRHSTNADPRIKRREKEWKAEKDKFVETVLEIHDILGSKLTPKSGKAFENNAEALGEFDQLRTRPSDGVRVGRERLREHAKVGRPRKNVHVVFDAMPLQDEWTGIAHHYHIVFVDNLPIDMEETDLFDLYSRCGPVQSVQIFNQREELDPGPLTAKKRQEQKLKQRQNTSHNRRHWKRPRTPVYGRITFTSHDGYNAAVDAPLRIFGMAVRKHAMRSIPASDMTKLFLEDIPKGMNSLDIEHKLSRLLHPHMYVCLDVGQHDFAEASSCEINFPSFGMAHYAFQKLHELDIEGSRLQ